MKLSLPLLFILIISSISLNAQEFGKNNPVWYFEQMQYMPGSYYGYHKFYNQGDTILGSDTLMNFSHDYIVENYPELSSFKNHLIKYQNQKVYWYSAITQDLKLLYDFSAETGDTIVVWGFFDGFQDSISLRIDSVGLTTINGANLKTQYVNVVSYGSSFYMQGAIYEGIGAAEYFFPICAACDPPEGGRIRCFQNDSIGLIHFTSYDCDYVGIESFNEISRPEIFPNPASSVISIQTDEEFELQLFSFSGQLLGVFRESPINLEDFPQGSYFVRILTGNHLFSQKLVILR